MVEKACVECGAPFLPNTANQKYCSVACRTFFLMKKHRTRRATRQREYERTKFGWKSRPTETMSCVMCDTVFLPKVVQQRCCTKQCAARLRYKENPEKYRAKAIRVRRKTVDAYRARGRMTWAQMRAVRGTDSGYRKSRYPWLPLLTGARHRAIKNGISFDLTDLWCDEKWNGRCELTNIEFVLNATGRTIFAPSIDRIEAHKGYTQDNCRFILWGLNAFKSNGTDDEMYAIANALVASAQTSPISAILSLPA